MAHKDELKMAEERLRLRHGGHKKWARDMRRFKGKMENKEIREQYHDMMREKNMLKDRQSGTKHAHALNDDSDISYSDDESVDSDELREQAIDQIKQELSSDESGDDESSQEEKSDSEESDEDKVVNVDFDSKQKGKK